MPCKHKLPKKEGYCEECGIYKQTVKELFHVFTDDYDDWIKTKSEALKIARKLSKKNDRVRVYHETEWNEDEGIFEDGQPIYSKGEFPY